MTDVGVSIAFWIMAVVSVGSALAVVLLRNIFRAALFLVAVMPPREPQAGTPSNRLQASALLVALLFLAAVAFVVLSTEWGPVAVAPDVPTTARLAEALFDTERGFVLPFELASVVLLAAMIGAIVLVRER